jgi:NAD(P)-dependent dehydrogenase (short-subunit alcohol dehydrogenase family)
MAVQNSSSEAVAEDSPYTQPIALKTWSMPEEQAAVVSFLLSAESSHVTGVNIMVDGGFSNTRP